MCYISAQEILLDLKALKDWGCGGGVLLWHSGLRIWCCPSSGLGQCHGMGSVLGPGTSTSCNYGQKIFFVQVGHTDTLYLSHTKILDSQKKGRLNTNCIVYLSSLGIINYSYQLRNGEKASEIQVPNTYQELSLQADSS